MDPVFFRVEELLLQTSSSDEHSTAAGLCVKHSKSLKETHQAGPDSWVDLPPSENESVRKKNIPSDTAIKILPSRGSDQRWD